MFMPFTIATIFDRAAAIPVGYWLAWFGSLSLSVALVVVLRTRWGHSRPLQKCALLSLLVHALLACITMTIRVVVGDGGGGGGFGTPIHVRLIYDSSDDVPQPGPSSPTDAESSTATAVVESTAVEGQPEVDQIAEEAPEPTDSPPPLPTAPTTASDPPPHDDALPSALAADVNDALDRSIDAATRPAPPAATDSNSIPENPLVVATDTEETPPVTAVEVSSPQTSAALPTASDVAVQPVVETSGADPADAAGPPLTGKYAARSGPGKIGLVLMQGGSTETEAAVSAALAWLARAQSQDGRWDANRFGAGQEHVVLDQNRGGAGRNADTGISALALLAFLGASHSHQQGDYQDTVQRGLDFLMRSQAPNGGLFGESTFFAQMYCHSMATFALAEAQAMTGDRRIAPALERAVQYCLRTQNAATGGWRYRASYDPGDTSQLGWQMMALASARRAGMDVPELTWTRIGRFLNSVRRGSHGGLASYRPDGPPSASMTAEALYCRLILQEMAGTRIDETAAQEATKQLLDASPQTNQRNLYYWYYASLALHARQQANAQALATWRRWNDALTPVLLSTQSADGPNAGSWDTNTVWGGYGGRVYTTAMATMCLEVYYRYAPSAPAQWMASRPADHEQPR